jgi:hypothetical protein
MRRVLAIVADAITAVITAGPFAAKGTVGSAIIAEPGNTSSRLFSRDFLWLEVPIDVPNSSPHFGGLIVINAGDFSCPSSKPVAPQDMRSA